MRRSLLFPVCLLTVGIASSPADAQFPYAPGAGYQPGGQFGYQPGYGQVPNPGAYLPNFYNPQNQPLSPYLNLLRGGNPAVNYYYGVRPGTPAGGMMPYGNTMFNSIFGPRYQYLPQASMPLDPGGEAFEPGGREVTLRSAGHPVLYGMATRSTATAATSLCTPSPLTGAGSARAKAGVRAGRPPRNDRRARR
jgi:hypothetical protein